MFEHPDDPARDFVAGMVLAADLRDIQPPDIQDHEDLMDALAETMKQLWGAGSSILIESIPLMSYVEIRQCFSLSFIAERPRILLK